MVRVVKMLLGIIFFCDILPQGLGKGTRDCGAHVGYAEGGGEEAKFLWSSGDYVGYMAPSPKP